MVGRQEAVARIRAAVDARNDGADILIVARTDARQAESLEVLSFPLHAAHVSAVCLTACCSG